MKPNVSLIFLMFLLMGNLCHGQVDNILLPNTPFGSMSYNYSSLFFRKASTLEDAYVRENRYWDKDWHMAAAKLKTGWVKIKNAKLDLFADEFHYLDRGGVEVIAKKGVIEKIAFYDRKDTTRVAAVFEMIATKVDKSDSLGYAQILNEGEIQLAKKLKFEIVQGNYDPMLGKTELRLLSDAYYFVAYNGQLSLAGLNRSRIISLLSATQPYTEWIKNNKLKSEEDIVAFLNYCERLKN